MKKSYKKILILFSSIIAVLLIGIIAFLIISNKKDTKPVAVNLPKPVTTPAKDTTVKPVDNNPYSPYTGEVITKEVQSQVPFMAIIENDRLARPQYGISEADIMYETMAEGGIPRFMGLFQKNQPTVIGPIRSARPYFLDLSLEWGLPFAHCGGSAEALNRIQQESSLLSLNEMSNGSSYWRDKTVKTTERSLRTSSEKIVTLIKNKNYVKPTTNSLKFDKTYWDNTSFAQANTINLTLNSSYSTSYTYKDGLYYKSMDGTASTDQNNGKAVTAKNIIIQVANFSADKDNYRVFIDLVGSGNGYLISNGKTIKITWSRKALSSPTIINDENGKLIALNQGNTWWHIVDKYAKVDIK